MDVTVTSEVLIGKMERKYLAISFEVTGQDIKSTILLQWNKRKLIRNSLLTSYPTTWKANKSMKITYKNH